MRTSVASGAVALLLGIGTLPVVGSGGETPPSLTCSTTSPELVAILATIRQQESGDDYVAQAAGSSASGAYQFIDSTWDGYGGFRRAADAPPAVQDARAAEHVGEILAGHGGDVGAIPVAWYIGHVPAAGSAEWDEVPYPGAGNVLTPRQYRDRWLVSYRERAGGTTPATGACAVDAALATVDGWVLPGPRALVDADPAALEAPHHDYAAWDWAIPVGTPLYAMRAGTIVGVGRWPHNWSEHGCSEGGGCDPCGIGVVITDGAGTRWSYCHGSEAVVTEGQAVAAGQLVMRSGNSGRSTGPHLHLGLRTADGAARCPQLLVERIYRTGVGIEPTALPTSGCSY